jgi:hypothetical protein
MIIKTKRILGIFLSILAILFSNLLSNCDKSNTRNTVNSKNEVLILNKLHWTENPQVDEMARFIAAQPLSADTRLAQLTANPAYKEYSEKINSAWNEYSKKHLETITAWQKEETGKDCGQNIFYPFSGPDIVHAATFFPDARSYHLFALEDPGAYPMPDPSNPAKELNDLKRILTVVGPVLKRPFWRTNDMKVQIGSSKYIGITSVSLFFLSRMNYKILDVYPVAADADGNLVKLGTDKATTSNAVAIFFKKPNEDNARALLYFQGDISDHGITKTPGLKKYIRSLDNYSTMLKSASYLMHKSSFDDTRNIILGKSNCILTDSSGVPFHYLNNGNWNIKVFGEYKGPIELFYVRHQPDLVAATMDNPVKLPFEYGYVFSEGKSHLILARRKADFPFFEPAYDEDDTVGETTTWEKPRVNRSRVYPKREAIVPILQK